MSTISFSEIYTNYYKRSFLFVKSYIRDDMMVEDIVSEALIKLWETSKQETIQHPQSLLLTILRNNTLNYLKHQEVRKRLIETMSSKMVRDLDYRITIWKLADPGRKSFLPK